MLKRLHNFREKISKVNFVSFWSFYLGILFLPSALPISIFFLLISIIINIRENLRSNFSFNNYDYTLLICSGIMLFSNLRFFFVDINKFLNTNHLNNFADLFNWLPLFLIFGLFNKYVKDEAGKKRFIIFSLIATVPVIFSCILQSWFGVYGPFKDFYGIIIWYQKPPDPSQSFGVSGLFSNPNYAAFWLSAIWPFSLLTLLTKKHKIISLSFFSLISYFALFTKSRNAIFSIATSLLLMINLKVLCLSLLIIIPLIIYLNYSDITKLGLNNFLEYFLPKEILGKISDIKLNITSSSRFFIYRQAFNYISISPILGWGATSFPLLYIPSGDFINVNHTHNIFLEITFNYGFIVAILLLIFIALIYLRSFKIIFFNKKYNSNINKAWFASSLTVIIFNATDIVYYDGKFSIFSWLLISGLKGIIDEHKNKLNFSKSNV